MLIGCCHCGEEPPSESIPPSESTPSASESTPSASDSGPSYSEISSSCISLFGCAAIPRRLTWTVPVSTGNWDGNPDCLCAPYDGTHTLKFCSCAYEPTPNRYVLLYATDELGTYRGRVGQPGTDLIGCRTKAAGPCTPFVANISNSRRYYCVVYSTGQINVSSTHYFTAQDIPPFPTTTLSRTWSFTGSVNCLASGSYSLTPGGSIVGLDGCGWGTGTLSPG